MMKRKILTGAFALCLVLATTGRANAQFVIGGIIKRVIMAIDLRIQRQQTHIILLQDAQKQLENLMQKNRLADISDWVEQQKNLYEEYYKELWQVKNALRYYSAVREIIGKQEKLIVGYKQAYAMLARDRHFSVEELGHIDVVYGGMLRRSVSVVEELEKIMHSFVTQMDDGDRLAIINDLSTGIDLDYRQLQSFSQGVVLLSLQRAKDENDLNMIKALYGIH